MLLCGSHETIFPSFQVGGTEGRLNYYAVGSYKQDNLGIENTTAGYSAIHKTGAYYGFYLQDSWKIIEPLTLNFGGRFDIVDEYAHANQLSPRVSIVLQATKRTTLRAGYARYFTPPPLGSSIW